MPDLVYVVPAAEYDALVAERDWLEAMVEAVDSRAAAEAFLRHHEAGRPDAREWGHVAYALGEMKCELAEVVDAKTGKGQP